MIKDCQNIFENKLDVYGDKFIIDRFTPKDGTYYLIKIKDNDFEAMDPIEIKFNKKTKQLECSDSFYLQLIRSLEYYSKLIDMNKCLDRKKTIHSNNFLSFAVKKDSISSKKLTIDVINGYYDLFKDMTTKYKGKSLELYKKTVDKIGEADCELVDRIRAWVLENIWSFDENMDKKDYLKLFFIYDDEEQTVEAYKKEGERYLIPNVYNSNEYNVKVGEDIYGLPNNNIGMNAKKPYLANKKRGGNEIPYLLNEKEVVAQSKFFDYLYGLVASGHYDVYFDEIEQDIIGLLPGEHLEREVSGYYMRLSKEKNEASIDRFEIVPCFVPQLRKTFRYKKLFFEIDRNEDVITDSKNVLEGMVNEVFFSKYLCTNYFTNPKDISLNDAVLKECLVVGREALFSWFHTNDSTDITYVVDRIFMNIIKNSIGHGNLNNVRRQINLRISLQDYLNNNDEKEKEMIEYNENFRAHCKSDESWDFTDDNEYYYAVGQVLETFIKKNKSAKRPLSQMNVYLNAKDDDMIKNMLTRDFKKYNYDIFDYQVRFKNVFSKIMAYRPKAKVNQQVMIAGALADNIFFEKREKEEVSENEEQ